MPENTLASEQASEQPRLADVASRGRLAFAVIAPPLAWSAQGLLGWYFSSHACDRGGPSWGPLSEGGVRTLLFAMSLAALALTLAALWTGYRGWRRLHAAGPGDGMRESAAFLAAVGVMAGTALAIGIFWATLPSLLVHVCGAVR